MSIRTRVGFGIAAPLLVGPVVEVHLVEPDEQVVADVHAEEVGAERVNEERVPPALLKLWHDKLQRQLKDLKQHARDQAEAVCVCA